MAGVEVNRKSAMLYYDISDIEKAIENVFKDAKGELTSEKREYVRLFSSMLLENDLAISSFIKIAAGLGLEKVVPNNTPVLIPLGTLSYNSSWSDEEIKEYANVNEDDYVLCQIASFNGYHRYSPYTVSFPGAEEEMRSANISRKDFTLLDDLVK